MLASLTEEVFSKKDWLFEIKWDGYRAVAEIEGGKVNLHSRNNISFNNKYTPVVESLKAFDVDMILDGEVVVLDNRGKSSFQLLQNYQKTGIGNLVYYVFDLLYFNGYDLTKIPLHKRKKLLKKLLLDIPNILFSDHIEEDGEVFYKAAEEKKLEGIIAKDGNSLYYPGKRTKDWLKIKTWKRQEAVIGGFTQPKRSRKKIGALVLGVYEGNDFIYIGHAGGGFTEEDLDEVYAKLEPLQRKTSPFKEEPETNTPVTWVKPELVCEVSFSEWTDEGLMRQPVFLGLREDKSAEKVVKEKPVSSSPDKEENIKQDTEEDNKANNMKSEERSNSKEGEITINNRNLKLTNLDKPYFPDDGYTKSDVIEYYRKVSEYILPYLKGRPESLNRHPNGIKEEGFYQKDVADLPPDWVATERIYSEHNDKKIKYLVCNDEATLVYMANLGCIELNPWFSRVENLDNPDYLVLDLDPEDISFNKVVETALAVKEVLDIAGTDCYCKTSGATGLHVYVPLNAKYNYDLAREFAQLIANIVHERTKDFTSIVRNPSKRQKKVYLDYLQNRTGQTLAAPYSIRPRPGAPVSTPLKWEEVKIGLEPEDHNISNTMRRLGQMGDIFKGVLGKGIDIEKCIKNLEKKLAPKK
jgi:bifunctional non-homologous end joining protein LigD